MFSWFSSAESKRFGKELAEFLLQEFRGSLGKTETKFAGKVEKTLARADERVAAFKQQHRPNVLQRAKVANAFLWTLRDGGVDQAYAEKLTDWLSIRL